MEPSSGEQNPDTCNLQGGKRRKALPESDRTAEKRRGKKR